MSTQSGVGFENESSVVTVPVETESPGQERGLHELRDRPLKEPYLGVYEQVPPSLLVDSLPEYAGLWTRLILDGERGEFTPPLFQEHDFGVFFNAGDLYTRPNLTSGEEITVSLARGRVLELGAGFGRVSRVLRDRGLEVVATDSDPQLVTMYKTRGWSDARSVTLPVLSESLGKFDTVIALRGILGLAGELDSVYQGVRGIRRLLNPGGRLIFTSSRVNTVVVLPGRSPLEYRYRLIYLGCRSPWVRATALPEWLAIPFLRELGFGNIEILDPSSLEGVGYYAFASLG